MLSKSIAGLESLTSADEFFLSKLIKSRGVHVHTMNRMRWPRYLVVGESSVRLSQLTCVIPFRTLKGAKEDYWAVLTCASDSANVPQELGHWSLSSM
jgi:hypothetical protein